MRRYKRFLADIETPRGLLTAHCPNTGAMLGCSDPGSEVWYSESKNPRRKYAHTLEVVCAPTGRVGVNTARANRLVEEAIAKRRIETLAGYAQLRREPRIPGAQGRFDFVLRGDRAPCYVEVKSLTLGYADGSGAFPDAVSERAVKHVHALASRSAAGDRAVLVFCVQHSGVDRVTTADAIHPEYGQALRAAMRSGVEVLAFGCRIERDRLELQHELPFALPDTRRT